MLTRVRPSEARIDGTEIYVSMGKYPNAVRPAFQPVKEVITSSLIEQLHCSNTSLAPRGSEKWNRQQAILNAWVCYLRRIEGMATLEMVYELHVAIYAYFV